MENLRNSTILIGRETGHGRLMIALSIAGKTKATAIGAADSVANSVSRCYPTENMAHCKIEIDANGNMRLTNMKLQNSTFVGKTEIMSKLINKNSDIYLGHDRWALPLNQVLEAANELAESMPKPQKELHIDHLESVWNKYQQELKNIQNKQKNLQMLTRIPMLFSMGGALLVAIGGPEIKYIAGIGTALALILMIYGLVKTKREDSMQEREQATKRFQRKYICPNPDCHHFLGNIDYEILSQDKTCRYCKCKWLKK